MDVGADQDRAEVLRVDRLRLAHAPRDLLGERRPHSEQSRAHLGGHNDAFRPADEHVMVDHARVQRVALARFQPHAVAAPDLVDEDDELTCRKQSHSGLWARMRQCQYACQSLPSLRSGCSCARASP